MTRRLLPLWILLALGLLLLLLHLALPHLVRNYLNDKMADMGDYQGHVEDVDLAWWRGAYRIEGLLIEKKDERVQDPQRKQATSHGIPEDGWMLTMDLARHP
ncbi:hypothetical protein OMR07_25790 [Methylobacterium organophilum]|nr:hypothetical protein [Methylobacterium organophilum]